MKKKSDAQPECGPRRLMSKAVLGGACMSLQPLLLSAVALPATAYVIRTLGPTQYGQWAMAVTLVYVTMFLSNLGLFFFQAEDGIRDGTVTGVQTCALPI